MQPREYLRPLIRGWWFVLLAIVVAVAAVVGVSKTSSATNKAAPNGYHAAATLVVSNTPAGRNLGQQLTSLTLLVPSGEVSKRVAAKLGYHGDPQTLASTIQVTNDPTAATLTITVPTDNVASHAELVANTFANELIGYLNEQDAAQAKADLDATTRLIGTLTAQVAALNQKVINETNAKSPSAVDESALTAQSRALATATERQDTLTTAGPPPPQLQLLSPAVASPNSSSTSFLAPKSGLARGGLAAGAALILSILILLVVDRLSTKITTPAAAELAFGLPVLAEIPPVARHLRRRRRPAPIPRDRSSLAEAYRVLRSGLLMTQSVSRLVPQVAGADLPDGLRPGPAPSEPVDLDDDLQVIQVVSANAGEGRTSCIVALAGSYAELGISVLVVDGDLRQPRIAEVFGGDSAPGLSDLLLGSEAMSVEDVIRPTKIPNVSYLSAGTIVDSPAELLPAVRSLLLHARSLADIVLVDSPPLLLASDSSELMAAVDAVVVVCRVGRTTADAAHRSSDLLARLAVPAAGVAMLGVHNAPVTRRSVRGHHRRRRSGPVIRVGAGSARYADDRVLSLLSPKHLERGAASGPNGRPGRLPVAGEAGHAAGNGRPAGSTNGGPMPEGDRPTPGLGAGAAGTSGGPGASTGGEPAGR